MYATFPKYLITSIQQGGVYIILNLPFTLFMTTYSNNNEDNLFVKPRILKHASGNINSPNAKKFMKSKLYAFILNINKDIEDNLFLNYCNNLPSRYVYISS